MYKDLQTAAQKFMDGETNGEEFQAELIRLLTLHHHDNDIITLASAILAK